MDDLSGPITPSRKRTCSFGGRRLPHTAILIDSSISPERDEAAARRRFYFVLFRHRPRSNYALRKKSAAGWGDFAQLAHSIRPALSEGVERPDAESMRSGLAAVASRAMALTGRALTRRCRGALEARALRGIFVGNFSKIWLSRQPLKAGVPIPFLTLATARMAARSLTIYAQNQPMTWRDRHGTTGTLRTATSRRKLGAL